MKATVSALSSAPEPPTPSRSSKPSASTSADRRLGHEDHALGENDRVVAVRPEIGSYRWRLRGFGSHSGDQIEVLEPRLDATRNVERATSQLAARDPRSHELQHRFDDV